MGADAIINVRYMTTSVVGSAAELLAYGTAATLSEQTGGHDTSLALTGASGRLSLSAWHGQHRAYTQPDNQ